MTQVVSDDAPVIVRRVAEAITVQNSAAVAVAANGTAQGPAGAAGADGPAGADGADGWSDSYATKALAEAATPAGDFLRTAGYHSAGDGGGGLYSRLGATQPDHSLYLQTADGDYWELVPEMGQFSVLQAGAKGDGSTDDTAAFNAVLQARTLAVIRDEYATSPKVVIPATDSYYKISSDLVIRRNIIIEGQAPHSRGLGSPVLKFTDACEAGIWFAAPGGVSAVEPYVTEVGADFYGSGRSIMRSVRLEPVNAGMVDYGIVHNNPVTLENVYCGQFKKANFFGHAQTSGDSAYGDPNGTAGGGTMWGNTNQSLYYYCVARLSTEGHGFAAQGNNAAISCYFNCDAAGNRLSGFLDQTPIGCAYINCHTAQNSTKVMDTGAALTTLASAVTSGVGLSIEVADASGITVGDNLGFVLSAGQDFAAWIGEVSAIAGTTITFTNATASAINFNADSGANVYLEPTVFLPIKKHTSASSNRPTTGADAAEYWIEINSTLPHLIWEASADYDACGGVNIVDVNGSSPVIISHYTEGGIEYGVIPRSNCVVLGGVATGNRAYTEGPDAGNVQCSNGTSATPSKWQGTDGTYEWGSALGVSRSSEILFSAGHTQDPSLTSTFDAVQLVWASVALGASSGGYELTYDDTPLLQMTTENWSLDTITPSGPRPFFEQGIVLRGPGGKSVELFGAFKGSALPTGQEVSRGTFYFLASETTSSNPTMTKCTTAGTVGSTAVFKNFGTLS